MLNKENRNTSLMRSIHRPAYLLQRRLRIGITDAHLTTEVFILHVNHNQGTARCGWV
jgi:hypothetical protein